MLDGSTQARKLFFHCLQQALGMLLFEGLVVCTTTSHAGTLPACYLLHLHIGDDDTCLGIFHLLVVAEMHIEIALGP